MKEIIIFIILITYAIIYSLICVLGLGLNQNDLISVLYNLFGGFTASLLMIFMIDKEIFKDLFKQLKK